MQGVHIGAGGVHAGDDHASCGGAAQQAACQRYAVNGGQKVTDRLMSEGQHIFCGIPKYIIYYYEFPNVKPGDVIEYSYSYTYTYGGFPEERVTPGTLVVE